jgi:septal ring factor EnvC (AmiA/AmiB activator)
MSVLDRLTGFARDLFQLASRVDKNAQDIEELRQDLKTLSEFSQKVAYAVKRNRDQSKDFKDQVEKDHAALEKIIEEKNKNLMLSLEIALLKLEKDLSSSHNAQTQPIILAEGNSSHLTIEANDEL